MNIAIEQAVSLLNEHDNILIISHKSPDGDTLGSAFALYYALTSLGKTARFLCSDPVPDRFCYFTDEYVESSFAPDFVVAVDIAATQLLGARTMPYAANIDLCIDHHPSNDGFAKHTYLVPAAAATCEIMFDVVTHLGAKITQKMADCLYTGISTDTGCFKFSNTTVNTHIVASKLFEFGADHEFINRLMFETKSKSRLKIELAALSSIEYFFDDRVAIISISQKMIEELNADESELDGISAIPRSIEGVEVGITIREKKEGGYKMSVRTTSAVDASKLCATFGGGGHKRAGGCFIDEGYQTAKRLIVEAIKPLLQSN